MDDNLIPKSPLASRKELTEMVKTEKNLELQKIMLTVQRAKNQADKHKILREQEEMIDEIQNKIKRNKIIKWVS